MNSMFGFDGGTTIDGKNVGFSLVVVLPVGPRRRFPVNNLICFISLLYVYLLLLHSYVMYHNYYIVLS